MIAAFSYAGLLNLGHYKEAVVGVSIRRPSSMVSTIEWAVGGRQAQEDNDDGGEQGALPNLVPASAVGPVRLAEGDHGGFEARADGIGEGQPRQKAAEMPPVVDAWRKPNGQVEHSHQDDLSQLKAAGAPEQATMKEEEAAQGAQKPEDRTRCAGGRHAGECQAEGHPRDSREKVDSQHSRQTKQPFDWRPHDVQRVHIHTDVQDADMKEDRSHKSPDLACEDGGVDLGPQRKEQVASQKHIGRRLKDEDDGRDTDDGECTRSSRHARAENLRLGRRRAGLSRWV